MDNKELVNNVVIIANIGVIIYILFVFFEVWEEIAMSVNEMSAITIIASSIFTTFIKCLYPIVICLGMNVALRVFHKDKLDETDFEKNKNYYRDIIENYNVGTLNYIDNFKIDFIQAYTAELLELQRRKIIEIQNNNINVIGTPKDIIDEKFISSIENNEVTISVSEYEDLCAKDALDKGLIIESDNQKIGRYFALLFIAPLAYFDLLLWSVPIFLEKIIVEELSILHLIVFIILLSVITVFLVAFAITYLIKAHTEHKRYERTKVGKEINIKLEGLKMFMKDFGDMKSKQADHLVLWEEYLIYSVMFDLNTQIKEEYLKFLAPKS